MNVSAIPAELRARPQWVRWKLVPDEPKPRKIPIRPSDPSPAASDDPATWGTFEEAQANSGKHGTCGVGFVFSGDYFGIDLDGCLTEEGGLDAKASALVEGFSTYTEISPSGTGIHLIGRGSLNGHRGMKRNGVELYDRGRYFTMTGNALPDAPSTIADCQPALDALVAKLDPPRASSPLQSPRPRQSDDPGRIVERARAYAARMAPAISGQGGHEATFRVAMALVKGFSLGSGTALDLMREYNSRCDPPWSEKELEHKVDDAGKADVPDGYILERDDPTPATTPRTPATTPAGGLEKHTVSIFEALQEVVTVPKWTVENLQDPSGIGILASDPYLGKTALLIGLGLHIAAGKDFLGFKIPTPVPGLFLGAEGAREKFKLRAKVIAGCYGIGLEGLPFDIHKKSLTRFPHFNTPDFRRLVEDSGKKVVFCDTARFFTRGDENSATDFMNLIVQPLKELSTELGIFFWMTTHYGKANENRSGSQKVRGTSAQKGDVDVLTRLEAPGGTRAPERTWIFDKVKDAAEPDDIPLLFQSDRGVFERGEGAAAPASDSKESRAKTRRESEDERNRKAKEGLALLFRQKPEGLTAEEARTAVNRAKRWVADVIDEFHARGWIRNEDVHRVNERGQKRRVGVWRWVASGGAEIA